MNLIQTAGAVAALLSSAIGGVYALDTRFENKLDSKVTPIEEKLTEFVPIAEYQDFQWAYLKGELRDLKRKAEQTGDPRLQRDYEELLDLFCRKFPDDRECM